MNQAAAILWAQWRTLLNSTGARASRGAPSSAWSGMDSGLVVRSRARGWSPIQPNVRLIQAALPGALLLVFLYWQVVPLLMAATGASLELRKLKVYPIPVSQLFAIEVMLRVTAGIEMVLVLIGIAVGVLLNPRFRHGLRWRFCLICAVQSVPRRRDARSSGAHAGPQAHPRDGCVLLVMVSGAAAGCCSRAGPTSAGRLLIFSAAIPGWAGRGPRLQPGCRERTSTQIRRNPVVVDRRLRRSSGAGSSRARWRSMTKRPRPLTRSRCAARACWSDSIDFRPWCWPIRWARWSKRKFASWSGRRDSDWCS